MINPKIKNLLAKVGIRNKYDAERHALYKRLKKQLDAIESETDNSGTVIIVFSKDRAMQLDALLRSYYHYAVHPIPVRVLYHASSPEYRKSYSEVLDIYKDNPIFFREEEHFKNDLIEELRFLPCAKILFLVDDVLFKRKIDMREFTSINPRKCISSLRLGSHLKYAYTLERNQALPSFKKLVGHPEMLSWNWSKGDGDWEYPLSVDGNLFDTREIRILVEGLGFKAPNSFEEALQLLKPYFANRKGLCYPESVVVNNPCNKVQMENDNTYGEIGVEELDQKWAAGYRIDFEEFEGLRNISAHQELSYRFVKR